MDIHERLQQLTAVQEADKEKIRDLIMNEGSRTKEIVVGGVSIRIRATIPRDTRHDAEKYNTIEEADSMAVEGMIYDLIAKMCVDNPFNNPETWKFIDDETGIAPEVFTAIFKEAADTETAIKRFRRK